MTWSVGSPSCHLWLARLSLHAKAGSYLPCSYLAYIDYVPKYLPVVRITIMLRNISSGGGEGDF